MRALLDTCVLLWWVGKPERLSDTARSILENPEASLFWSAASSWEVALKASSKGLHMPLAPRDFLRRVLDEEGILSLPIEDDHALQVLELPKLHRDPFDRLLVAQAQVEDLALVSSDSELQAYDVEVVW